MANKKISDLPAAGNLEANDALELSQNSTSVKMTLGDMGWNTRTFGAQDFSFVSTEPPFIGLAQGQTPLVVLPDTSTQARIGLTLDLDELAWKSGSISYDLLYTSSTTSTGNFQITTKSHAFSLDEALAAGSDLDSTDAFAGPSTANTLQSQSITGSVSISSSHEIVSVLITRDTADAIGGLLNVIGLRATLSS
jgi:hypothetical protein